jgi:S-layer homology domain
MGTSTVTATSSPCPMNFSDVHVSDYFYQAIHYLYCRNMVSGYSDNSFRPYNNVTRGQLCKIVVLAEGWPTDTTDGPHFSDVPTTNPFYAFVETAYSHTILSGYSDGTFRPGNNATRGQICKIANMAITQP